MMDIEAWEAWGKNYRDGARADGWMLIYAPFAAENQAGDRRYQLKALGETFSSDRKAAEHVTVHAWNEANGHIPGSTLYCDTLDFLKANSPAEYADAISAGHQSSAVRF